MRGSIKQRGTDSLLVAVSAGFDPVTGKRRRRYVTVRRGPGQTAREWKAAAEAELARIVHELETGTDLDPGRLSVADYMTRWLEHTKTRVRPSTWRRYDSLVRLHIVPAIGGVKLRKLRAAHVQKVLDGMLNAGAAPRSVVMAYRIMSAALRRAVKWGLVAANPAAGAQAPQPSRPDLRIPDPDELRALLAASEQSRYGAAIALGIATGLRRGEILALRWQDVDLDAARLRVTATLDERTLELMDPKTDRGRRELALPAFAVERLRHHRKDQAERRLGWGEDWHDLGFVFDRRDGRPIFPNKLSAEWRQIADGLGLEGIRLHDARHGWATTLMMRGVHPKIVSEGLGHASTSFTLDTYSHVVPGLQEQAAQAIESALGGDKVATTAEGER